MSPRAAWQLEALGFTDVYDFVPGKQEWIGSGLPVEGHGPHYPLAGEVATRDRLLVCRWGETCAVAAKAFGTGEQSFCVVVNDHDIVLGRVRRDAAQADPDAHVEDVMESGPTTIRPSEPARGLLERMTKRNVPALLVTTVRGKLVGLARRRDLEKLVARSGS